MQGIYDTASKAQLIDEFGTARDEDVVRQILERGEVQASEVSSSLVVPITNSSPFPSHPLSLTLPRFLLERMGN